MGPADIPHKIGRYKVLKILGRGGMGQVYLAVDPFIDRHVAIKMSTSAPSDDESEQFEEYQQDFFNEARAAGKLMHRNIVSVYDAMVEEGQSYMIMEYVEGDPLSKYCRKSKLLALQRVVNIIFQCAKALDYAHRHGVIHRDIKPSNILVNKKGRPKISDFGIASVKGASRRDNDPVSGLTGSLFYTPPEQLRHEPLTPQADIFSLGVVMYEILTGEKPFQADNPVTVAFKILNEVPPPVKRIRQDLPESLSRIVSRCLAKDPSERYQTGAQLAQELIASFDHLRNVRAELNHEEKLNALKKIDFFKEFSMSELAEVVSTTSWVRHEAASKIISEGEIDDSFFIIVSGEVVVRKRGKRLAMLNAGDCFGEMAWIGKTKRTASIVSMSSSVLMKMNASMLEQMSMSTQFRFYKVFATTLIRRLARTSELLSKSS